MSSAVFSRVKFRLLRTKNCYLLFCFTLKLGESEILVCEGIPCKLVYLLNRYLKAIISLFEVKDKVFTFDANKILAIANNYRGVFLISLIGLF